MDARMTCGTHVDLTPSLRQQVSTLAHGHRAHDAVFADALAFSGGIGTHAAVIRARVVAGLEWLDLGIDPGLNESNAVAIDSAAAAVRTFVLTVDEADEMARMVADARP